MDTPKPSQEDSWQNNIYILSTIRVLMALMLILFIRSLYQLFQRIRMANHDAGAAMAGTADAIGIDVEAVALGPIENAAMFGLGPVDGISETLQITLPQPTYIPPARLSPRAVSLRQQT